MCEDESFFIHTPAVTGKDVHRWQEQTSGGDTATGGLYSLSTG